MPKLVVSINGVVLKEVSLVKASTTMGRRPYNDIVLDNLAVSGEHAVLHKGAGGEIQLEDLHSTNGTVVNGLPIVNRQALKHQDQIEIGKYKITFMAQGMSDAPPGEPATASAPEVPIPMPLSQPATDHIPMDKKTVSGAAILRVLAGPGAGQDMPLKKVVTTVGKPGIAVAAVTRRLQGYVVAPIDGGALLNNKPLGTEAVPLQEGDMLELGGIRLQFTYT